MFSLNENFASHQRYKLKQIHLQLSLQVYCLTSYLNVLFNQFKTTLNKSRKLFTFKQVLAQFSKV